MEKEILKFICASQGAVDADFLVCNLGGSVSEIISSSDKFVTCCPFGQPKVVARTNVKLCRNQVCPGSCLSLHLCKSFLFSGSCQLMSSWGCSFSHELNSKHNKRILREHELEDLSRKELCTLLLQSDTQMLPPVCHDYNNGPGMFGRCQSGYGCKRVHICERFLNRDCRCSRNHNFRAPQTLKALQDVPKHLIDSLKSTYANIQAMKYQEESHRSDPENRCHGDSPEQSRATGGATDLDAGCSMWQYMTQNPEEVSHGRGNGRGRRRHGRKSRHQEGEYSIKDLRTTFNALELMGYMGCDGWQ